jgi:serine/threonine protein kinase
LDIGRFRKYGYMQYDQFLAGEYQIERTLERSQYSVLCIGKKCATGQPVLLRLWLTAQAETEEEQTRIREEVAALQSVKHPHLLPILDVHADAQKVFLVGEYASAGSLNGRLGDEAEEALSLDETLLIIEQVGRALHALHKRGIIHGNLTPQAVFFTGHGEVKLGEFLVRSVLVSIQDYQHILDENVPRCLYMAPEQFRGMLNAKTDQYALSCLAYVLLTGRVPFAGSARATLLQKHQRDEPQALTISNPAVPAHIEAAVLKALAKKPEERYDSVPAFIEALDVPGKKVLADQNTIKQPVPGALFEEAIDADELWEWEVSIPSEGPLKDSGPTRTVGSSSRQMALIPLSVGSRPRSAQFSRKQELYVVVPLIVIILLLIFVTGRWLFLPSASGSTHPQASADPATPTSVLLTPATAPSGSQPTAPSTVVAMQIPTPAPTPVARATPSVSPTPTMTSTPSVLAVTPFLDCVSFLGFHYYLAKFGYQNSNTATVTIPQGGNNNVTINPANGPPDPPLTSFTPGTQHQVLQIHFYGNQTVTWTIEGHQASAMRGSNSC